MRGKFNQIPDPAQFVDRSELYHLYGQVVVGSCYIKLVNKPKHHMLLTNIKCNGITIDHMWVDIPKDKVDMCISLQKSRIQFTALVDKYSGQTKRTKMGFSNFNIKDF